MRLAQGWMLGALALASLQAGPSLGELRAELELARADGLCAEELRDLGARSLQLADDGGSRRKLWDALGLTAQLCAQGPPPEARALRARALELLASRESDTLRWSVLVGRSFLPPFERLPRASWAGELAAYDTLLERLHATATDARVRAELLHARAFARVDIDRRFDWLDAAAREQAIEMFAELAREHGSLSVPGTARPQVETVARRCQGHADELRRLHFGALAPTTSGVDLEGAPFDLADLRGQVVVLDFWSSFCVPCLALVPGTRAMLEQLAGEPVAFVGVCGDTTRAEGAATARRVGMTWPSLWDGPLGTEGPASTAWNVAATGWPSVFVLDREGRIRHKLAGKERIEAELEAAVRALLAEGRAAGAR